MGSQRTAPFRATARAVLTITAFRGTVTVMVRAVTVGAVASAGGDIHARGGQLGT